MKFVSDRPFADPETVAARKSTGSPCRDLCDLRHRTHELCGLDLRHQIDRGTIPLMKQRENEHDADCANRNSRTVAR